jgi:hypothetical protein
MVFKRACRAQKDLALMIFFTCGCVVLDRHPVHADDFIYDLAFFLKYGSHRSPFV